MSRPAVWPPRVSGNPANGHISMSTNDAFFSANRSTNLAIRTRFYESRYRDSMAAKWIRVADDADLLAEALADAAMALCCGVPIPVPYP